MAQSNVAIAKRALQMLGARTISSLTQDHPNARAMNTAFEPVRDKLLRQYQWNFAKKRASVAADAVQTTYEGLNRFLKPNDFIALLREDTTASLATRKDWEIEGNYIVTGDSAPLEFRYIARITDPKQFDSLFDELFAAELALATVDEITESNVKAQRIQLQYRDPALLAARQANALESPPQDAAEDEWLQAMR